MDDLCGWLRVHCRGVGSVEGDAAISLYNNRITVKLAVPFLKIAWSVLECKFVWLSKATRLLIPYNNLLILAERYSYLNLNVTVVI